MTNFITVLYWRFSVEMFTPTKNMKQLTEWSRSITDQNATTWWRHQMETFSALLAICAGNSPVPVNSPHKGQWCGTLMFSLICVWINGWVNNREAGDLRRYRTHYDVTAMFRYRAELLHRYKKDTICHVNMAQLWDLSNCVLEKTTVLKIYCSFEYLWRDQMETSRYWPLCAGNSPTIREFPSQRPLAWSFGIFFDLRLNKQFSKQS